MSVSKLYFRYEVQRRREKDRREWLERQIAAGAVQSAASTDPEPMGFLEGLQAKDAC